MRTKEINRHLADLPILAFWLNGRNPVTPHLFMFDRNKHGVPGFHTNAGGGFGLTMALDHGTLSPYQWEDIIL